MWTWPTCILLSNAMPPAKVNKLILTTLYWRFYNKKTPEKMLTIHYLFPLLSEKRIDILAPLGLTLDFTEFRLIPRYKAQDDGYQFIARHRG